MEVFVTLFDSTPAEGNRPHYKGFLKIDGVEHEFALWPSKSGKGFTGRAKLKGDKPQAPIIKANDVESHLAALDDEIPF
ncbi:hypothetical protein UFOVP191_26 [uncultured Caudovirales phage]|uniref:DUF736 domain-containing protein n=1 Tax=uncultured Caudovirales phage TaxID=2100421 RepID=A0A6J7WFD6_9CAUD|nr:hypothetical protein UFOVP191_26 [uncultured Caudovirales phage]